MNMTKNYLLLYLVFYKSINNERIQSYEYKKSKRRTAPFAFLYLLT